MKLGHIAVGILTGCLILSAFASAQVDAQSGSTATVPRLIRITGSVRDEAGKPLSGNHGVTFTLYQDEGGQLAVWQETQNVQLDSQGRYRVLLGASSEAGLPLQIFSAGEARWLGVRPDGQEEQPRILFLSVAYALKAADTDMLGGRPASAYALAAGQNTAAAQVSSGSQQNQNGPVVVASATNTLPLLVSPATACSPVTSGGTATANQIAKFTAACNIEISAIFESSGNVGIGNTAPAGTLDVSGTEVVRGELSLTPSGTATATQGYNSNPLDLQASAYSSTSSSAVTEDFRWEAEPTGNNSSSPSGTLNLLFGANGSAPTETGLSVGGNGIINFVRGQTFPGTGSGTVTSVATGGGLTGGPITSSGTISIPSGGVTNSMLANNSVTVTAGSGLSGGGAVALGQTITLTNSAPGLGGTVTSVGSGTGLTGGPITGSGTLSLNTAYTDDRYLQLAGGTLTGGLNGTTGTFSGALSAGAGTFSGAVTEAGAILPPTGTATATQGYNSNPLQIDASVYNTGLSKPVTYVFQWQAEPLGNDSGATASSLNLLWGSGTGIEETGLSIAKNGIINFASGQTFPGGGGGTVTSVGTGTGLTGGPITTSGTISLITTCSTNQVLQWNGSAWVCASISGGSGGTVTSVTAGSGLTASPNPITGSGTISIPSGGVTSSMLANNSLTVTAGSGLSGGGPVALGGSVSLSANLSGQTDGIAYFSGPSTVASTNAPTNGQILIGSTGKAPVLTTLTAGSNVSISNGPGSITISATGGGGGSPTLPFFVTSGGRTGSTITPKANVAQLWGFLLPYNVTTTQVTYDVSSLDKTANNYDIGIYTTAGALVVNVGATAATTFASATGFKSLPWKQGSTSLTGGEYYLAITTNCASSCAKLGASGDNVSFASAASGGASTGGALPSSVTPPAPVWNSAFQPAVVIQ